MVIAIDVRPLMGGNTSGVEVYIRQLLSHLFEADKQNSYILYLNGAKKEEQILNEFKKENVTTVHTRYPNKIFNIFLTFLRWPKIDKLIEKRCGKIPEVFLIPDIRPTPLSNQVKKITVVHDLAYEHFPQFFSWRTKLWYKLINPQREIKESHGIIAVSKFTQSDIIKTYNIEEYKIYVIHEGVSESFGSGITKKKKEQVRKKYNLPEKYFLFLSTLEPRKNIHNLVRAFQQFKDENTNNIKLVIAGKPNHRIFSKMPHYKTEDIIFPGFIEEEDKATLYTMAEAFIYPSIFEGFGLPLLEAMKCQTPIISSNVSSIPEVTEDAAILINPDKPQELKEAMEKIIESEVQKDLRTKMEKQVRQFTWERCAAETLIALYLSA